VSASCCFFCSPFCGVAGFGLDDVLGYVYCAGFRYEKCEPFRMNVGCGSSLSGFFFSVCSSVSSCRLT